MNTAAKPLPQELYNTAAIDAINVLHINKTKTKIIYLVNQ